MTGDKRGTWGGTGHTCGTPCPQPTWGGDAKKPGVPPAPAPPDGAGANGTPTAAPQHPGTGSLHPPAPCAPRPYNPRPLNPPTPLPPTPLPPTPPPPDPSAPLHAVPSLSVRSPSCAPRSGRTHRRWPSPGGPRGAEEPNGAPVAAPPPRKGPAEPDGAGPGREAAAPQRRLGGTAAPMGRTVGGGGEGGAGGARGSCPLFLGGGGGTATPQVVAPWGCHPPAASGMCPENKCSPHPTAPLHPCDPPCTFITPPCTFITPPCTAATPPCAFARPREHGCTSPKHHQKTPQAPLQPHKRHGTPRAPLQVPQTPPKSPPSTTAAPHTPLQPHAASPLTP